MGSASNTDDLMFYIRDRLSDSGKLSDIPRWAKDVFLPGATQVIGKLADLPPLAEYIWFGGSEGAVGGDVADLPQSAKFIMLDSAGVRERQIVGDLKSLPRGAEYVHIGNSNLTGSLHDIPENMTYLRLHGRQQQVRGGLAELALHHGLTYLDLFGCEDIFGNASELPASLSHLAMDDAAGLVGYCSEWADRLDSLWLVSNGLRCTMKQASTGWSIVGYSPWSLVGYGKSCAHTFGVDAKRLGAMSVLQCQATVHRDPDCGAYMISNGAGCSCMLDGVGCDFRTSSAGNNVYTLQATTTDMWVTGENTTADIARSYTLHAGMGSARGNMISKMAGTVQQCADACNQVPNCVGFTMLGSTRCKLKSGVTLTISSGKNTYVKEVSNTCSQYGGIPHQDGVTCCAAACGSFCGARNCAKGPGGCCADQIPDDHICSNSQQAPCTQGLMWAAVRGGCKKVGTCVQSPCDGSRGCSYTPEENCTVEINPWFAVPIRVNKFVVPNDDGKGDHLIVNGEKYDGRIGPISVIPTTSITWTADSGSGWKAWELCAD